MKPAFNRRALLRGLGGAVVAAPFLSSVAEREAKAQGMAPPSSPKRLIVFFTHYGCLTNRWFPAKSHGRLTRDDYAKMKTLAPMAPYADKLLMVRGIRAMNEWSFDGTLGQKNDPHAQVCASYFTCHPVTPNATSPLDSSPLLAPKATGRSLDHVCAEQVNPDPNRKVPLFLEIGGVNGSGTNTASVISWDQPGRIFPGVASPTAVLNALTNLFGQGAPTPDDYRAVRRRTVIDCVRDDLNRLLGVNMSRSDKQKLSAWVELLHQTSSTIITSGQCDADSAAKLGLTADRVKAASVAGTKADLTVTAPVMMDLAALAAICDQSRVIFMKMPPNYVYKFLGLSLESHTISHRVGSANMGGSCVEGAIEMIQAIDAWYAEQFAYLVGRLDGIKEGDRTMLDNSATVWFQEMSDGNAHNLNNLPILQAGSCGGYFKVGQAVNVDGGVADMTPGHSDEDCKNGQSPTNALDSWGTPATIASQPINKYYCNLMNAIGVKAGPDGYPMVGGTEPVTKYGKYDDTTLFKTDTPSTIKDPGEYASLRA